MKSGWFSEQKKKKNVLKNKNKDKVIVMRYKIMSCNIESLGDNSRVKL